MKVCLSPCVSQWLGRRGSLRCQVEGKTKNNRKRRERGRGWEKEGKNFEDSREWSGFGWEGRISD